jgi:ligand-binding sensor domain-containing protein/AraC-like DNA-binding protein
MATIREQKRGIRLFIMFLMRVFVILCLLLFVSLPGGALSPEKPVGQYFVDSWEVPNGLPSNTILTITQTPDGFLWIATAQGLVRFDGIQFISEPIALQEKYAHLFRIIPEALHVDREGNLWIASSAGLAKYHVKKGVIKLYTTADGLTKERVRRIKEDMNGNIWISFFSSYVNRLNAGKFTPLNDKHGLTGKKINYILEDKKGNLLFGTYENGIFVYRNGRFYPSPIAGLKTIHLVYMHEDSKARLWLASRNGLYCVVDADSLSGVRKITTEDGLSNNYITAVLEDNDHNIWVGTVKGLNRLRLRPDGSMQVHRLLDNITVTFLFEDQEKSIWIGTFNSGVKRLKDNKIFAYPPLREHKDEILLSVAQAPNGDILIGTINGKIFRCRGKELLKTIKTPSVYGTGIAALIYDHQGTLWLGTNGEGILKGDAYTPITTSDGLADNLVTSITLDSKNNLWFCTFDGVSVLRSNTGKLESFKSSNGLAGKVAHNVYEDNRQNIWIATDRGVTKLTKGKTGKTSIENYLQGIPVTCIRQDLSAGEKERGLFWMATHGSGFIRFQAGSEPAIVKYTSRIGLPSDYIYQFFEDRREHFWMMSSSGLLRVGKKELNRIAQMKNFSDAQNVRVLNCTTYGISDGMPSPEFNNELSRHSAVKTAEGELLFITKKGIAVVKPEEIHINKNPPPVTVEALFFDDRPVFEPDSRQWKGVKEIKIFFNAPTFLSPGKVKFKYILEGINNEWQFLAPGSERCAVYNRLSPGTYTFRVIAGNSEGIWNRTGASVRFTIAPYFYQTFQFQIVSILLALMLLFFLIYSYKRYRTKVQEHPEEPEQQDIREKPDKYKGSTLTPEYAEECIRRLNKLMEEKNTYCSPDISLQSLADALSVNSHILSRILNEKLNQGFWDYINSNRIEEAKRILQSPRGAKLKIITVAFDVGFNTKVAFYNAFRKYTGMTPSQYKQHLKE